MKLAYRVGLALLVNVAIVSGSMLLGMAGAIGQPAPQQSADVEQSSAADRLIEQGNQQLATSQYEAAQQSYEQALKIYRQVKDRNGEAKALVNLGNAYDSLSQYDKAIGYYQQAVPIFQQIKDRDSES